jgi:tetratricopeptide (TPR) repeat protein
MFTPSRALTHAFAAFTAGRLVEAEHLCQRIIDAKPDLFDAHHLLAVVRSRQGKNETALASYDRALNLRPDCAEALCNRGLALYELKRFAEALTSYERGLTLRPDFAEAHNNRGLVLHELKRFEEALASCERALSLRPDFAEALFNRGNALHGLKRFAEALASYDRALTLRPDFAEALCNRGNALHELKRFAEALASYDRALILRPDFAEALCNRGLTLHELKHFAEALASYERALILRPNYAEAHNNCGFTLHELRRFDEALASCERALNLWPDFAEALFNRGNALHELKRFEEALASYERALELRPDYAEALCNRGNALHELKRFEEALASYERALDLRADFPEALCNRGLTLHELRRFAEALASYEHALNLRPNYAEALCNRGNALKELNQFKEALASYDHALGARPDYAEAHNNRGVALMQLGRLSEARAALEHAVELAPRKAKYRRDLGNITRFVAGDAHVNALEKLVEDSATASVGDRIELHFALAQAYEDLGRHAEAFTRWLDGNALKRRQIAYDEAATLGMLDRVRAAFTSEFIRTWQDVGNPSSLPIFIVGMARSGSTLVEQILASHEKVFGSGELRHFGAAVNEMQTKFGGLLSFPEQASAVTEDDFRNLGARYLAELQQLAPAAARITDKMPMNFMFAGLIHLALPNAIIIHTVRDPVDTCLSCFSKLFSDGHNHTYDLAELGRYYRHYQALMAHWHRVLPPGRILDVRYEDVVADLEGQARRVIAHCRLSWDPHCLAFHKTERAVRTASAAQVRQPIYNSAVGRWRVHGEALQPLLAELGITESSKHIAPPQSTHRSLMG